jgi:methyltransferase family protein
MNRYLEVLQGLNFAALRRGFQEGPRAVGRASRAACMAALPVADSQQAHVCEQTSQIPVVPLDDLLGDRKCEIKLRVMKYEDGMTPYHDSLALLSILVAENPSEVLEIGTYMGHTARAMAENLETATIHTIDLPADFSGEQAIGEVLPKNDFHLIARRDVGREFKGQACEIRIVQHLGDTAVMDFSRVGRPTFFFIDGSHTYEYCKNDSEKCLSLCPKGGTFLWHDCYEGQPGVIKLLSEWRAYGRNISRVQGTGLAYWKSH